MRKADIQKKSYAESSSNYYKSIFKAKKKINNLKKKICPDSSEDI